MSRVEGGVATDASGSEMDFQQQMQEMEAMFHRAQVRNLQIRKITTEEGTELKAAGKDVNPK